MTPPPPETVSRARCRNHADREAVARCPECGHTFCRECIVEHEGRMICKECLEKLLAQKPDRRGRMYLRRAALWGLSLISFLLTWSFFLLLGRLMILLQDLRRGLAG
ncbi:MAG: rhomboid family protein [Verrucomicrobia bacterium]|nr:rhomboid family protein [Verrucomicrobiota bacterium]MCH8526479.1 rhomboid family protein [Kiritimatiellia bacterium]